MKHTYIFLIIAFFFTTSLFGQKVLKTKSGQRILLVDDGSWRLLTPIEDVESNTSEEGTSLNSFKSPQQGKYPLNADQRIEIQSLLANFLSDEAQLLVNIEMSYRKLDQLLKEKDSFKKDKSQVEKIEYQIASNNLILKRYEKNYNSIFDLIKTSNKLLVGKIKNTKKAFASLKTDSNSLETVNTGMGGNAIDTPELDANIESVNETVEVKKYPTTFSLNDPTDYNNDYDCEIIFDGYDKDIGSDRKEVKTQRFFSYSQEKMKPYFKADDFLICDANISKVGKKYFLTLKIRIRSKDASKTYGSLIPEENIKLELINGRRVYGRNINGDKGEIESYTGHTLYKGIFELQKEDIKELKKYYIDHIGIIWSSGYEKYDIYNVDFLTNQLKCLTK